MGEKADDMKGRAKEAVGAATDDDEMKNEGKADQAGAKVKETANDAVDKVKGAFDKD